MTRETSPFLVETERPLVAIRGKRNGYIQLAPSREVTGYADFPETALVAAKDWAATLETLGARRVYWITLSEMVRHLHIHLYPRWEDVEEKGLALFEGRDGDPQPAWTDETRAALKAWANAHAVHIVS